VRRLLRHCPKRWRAKLAHYLFVVGRWFLDSSSLVWGVFDE